MDAPKPGTRLSQGGWQIFWFFIHLAAVYVLVEFFTPWLAGWTRGSLLPLLHHPTSSGRFEFLFSHILALSFIPAFLSGLVNARFRHKTAQFVWLVPTAILAYKFATFPAPSVLESQLPAAFHQYFGSGFLVPEFRSWRQLFSIAASDSDMTRGMAQLRWTAPFYAGVGYSSAAWIGCRIELSRDGESLTLRQPIGHTILSLLFVAVGLFCLVACVHSFRSGNWIFVLIFSLAALFCMVLGVEDLREVLRFGPKYEDTHE